LDDASVVGVLNLYEAKTRLSSLVDQAAAGAEIIIAKNGRPRAKLVPYRETTRRRPGRAKGKIWMSADFDAPLPKDVLDAFAGGPVDE
jgi:prevent-host-death family protein